MSSFDGDLGDPEQDLLFASDTSKVGDQFTLDAAVGVRVDLVDQPEEQIDQRVGTLGPARPAQRGDKRHSDRLR